MLGESEVTTVHNGEIYHNLKLCVVSGNGVNLLGRSWLSYITLDWKKLFSGNSCHANKMNVNWHIHEEVTSLLNKHSMLFSEQLGTIKGLRATLNVKPDAQAKFYKARNVPFALQEAVEAELDRMEKDGMIRSVTHSEWASPIVIVPKPDGRIRLCGDYKRTVNPVITNDIYPQPTPDELFAKMQGGKTLFKSIFEQRRIYK